MRSIILGTSTVLLLAASTTHLHAQSFATGPCDKNNNSYGDKQHVCEVRTATLPLLNGKLAVSGKNGSIDVVGEDRADVRLEAQVEAQAATREEAEAIEHKIEIVTNGEIRAQGPDNWGLLHQSNWSVSYRLRVPRHLAAHLHTENGSVKLAEVEGAITAETTNGGMTLSNLAGDVNAHTTNGSLHVSLAGSQWKGSGLSAKTTNGSVTVNAPADYSAHLIAETTNGGLHVGLPNAPQGKLGHHLDTNLGQGGSTLNFATVNGSLHIDHN